MFDQSDLQILDIQAAKHSAKKSLLRGGAQYSKLRDLNDPGSLRVGGSEGRDVLDHYHNVIP